MMTETIPTNGNGSSATLSPTPTIEMHEAPFSWNTTAQDESGFVEQFTVRAVTFAGFCERVELMKARLAERGYKPVTRSAPTATRSAEPEPSAPQCAIHKVPMVRRTKDGKSWWSCNQKLDDGSYCPYRPK